MRIVITSFVISFIIILIVLHLIPSAECESPYGAKIIMHGSRITVWEINQPDYRIVITSKGGVALIK